MDTLSIRAFDVDGNRLEPCWEDSSSGASEGSGASGSSSGGSSSTTPSAGSPASSSGLLDGGVCSSSFEQDADVKQVTNKARR